MTGSTVLNIAEDYPRPRLTRPHWADLCGLWDFAWGTTEDRSANRPPVSYPQQIRVPYPPESPGSGIGAAQPSPVLWYRLLLSDDQIRRAGWSEGRRLLLHCGAVDYRATVWLGGAMLGHHEGGMTPFTFDITDLATEGQRELVVRAVDDPGDVEQPRGKQDWQTPSHSIWYDRTSGIWQPVWLESVPAVYLTDASVQPTDNCTALAVRADIGGLTVTDDETVTVSVDVSWQGETLGRAQAQLLHADNANLRIELPTQRNGQQRDELLWSPETPRLLDVEIRVTSPHGEDHVGSYAGLRTVRAAQRTFWLNDRPCRLRAVLEQGYWPDTHLAAPDGAALRREVELIKELGFNAVRVHQKVEDPRFLYWADRLGLLVWGEMAATYEFSQRAATRLITEWAAVVRRDSSHPCIVTWVPLNESWGVQHIATDHAQQQFAQALASLTRALDPSRPVISNDGWEHVGSDLWTIHDYADTGAQLAERYGDEAKLVGLLRGVGPAGRVIALQPDLDTEQPFLLTEFGGVSLCETRTEGAWGYSDAADSSDLERRLADLFTAIQGTPLAGFCYTQLTDTGLETNGLLDAHRRPKIPTRNIRAIVHAVSSTDRHSPDRG